MFLKVENLSMTYDKKVLYDKASFSVNRGEKIGIVGGEMDQEVLPYVTVRGM